MTQKENLGKFVDVLKSFIKSASLKTIDDFLMRQPDIEV